MLIKILSIVKGTRITAMPMITAIVLNIKTYPKALWFLFSVIEKRVWKSLEAAALSDIFKMDQTSSSFHYNHEP